MTDVCCLPLKCTASLRANDNGSWRTAVVVKRNKFNNRPVVRLATLQAKTVLDLHIRRILSARASLVMEI